MALLGDEVRRFLARRRVAHLATADASGVPHVVPLCFAVAEDDVVYFVVDSKPKRRGGNALKRMRNIAANPSVAIVADEYAEDWSTLAYVLLRGTGAVVTDSAERDHAIGLLRAKYPQYRTMTLDGDGHPVVRIRVAHVHAWHA